MKVIQIYLNNGSQHTIPFKEKKGNKKELVDMSDEKAFKIFKGIIDDFQNKDFLTIDFADVFICFKTKNIDTICISEGKEIKGE